MKVGPHLPVDFLPRNAVSLSDESYKFLEVPVAVDDVLGAMLTVRVDKARALAAAEDLALLLREEFVAVSALVEVVLVFLE